MASGLRQGPAMLAAGNWLNVFGFLLLTLLLNPFVTDMTLRIIKIR